MPGKILLLATWPNSSESSGTVCTYDCTYTYYKLVKNILQLVIKVNTSENKSSSLFYANLAIYFFSRVKFLLRCFARTNSPSIERKTIGVTLAEVLITHFRFETLLNNSRKLE
jgi:hypothetical protein